MLSNYVKDILTEKVKILLEIAGKSSDVNLDSIVNSIDEYGKYEIIWNRDFTKPVGTKRISDDYRLEVRGGKYYLLHENGTYVNKVLFSSQFIDFNIQKYRDEKLGEILGKNNKIK